MALVLTSYFLYNVSMQVRFRFCVTWILGVLLVTLSAGVCVAQNPVKELPQAMVKTKAVPYAVNPALPAALRENLATGVLRPGEAVAAQRAAAANMLHVPAGTLNVPAGVQNAPAGNASAGTTNRAQTGRVRLQATPLAPTNPQRITPKRSEETGWQMKTERETETAKTPRKTTGRAPKRTPEQLIADYTQWTIDHPGTSPRTTITEKGKSVSLTELRKRAQEGDEQAAKLAYELELGQATDNALRFWPKTFPEGHKILKSLYDANRNTRTPQQLIADYTQWTIDHPGTSPRQRIKENGKIISLTELRKRYQQGDKQAARLVYELKLGQALNTALQKWPKIFPEEYNILKKLYDANRNTRTPQQLIADYTQWTIDHPGTSPRTDIKDKGKSLTLTELRKRAKQGDEQAAALAYELELGRATNQALQTWPERHPKEYQKLKPLYDANRNTRTPQQLLADYTQWTIDHPDTSPRQSIIENGKLLTLTELRKRAQEGDEQAAALAYELELGRATGSALQTWPERHPKEYQKLKVLYDENKNIAAPKTRQQVIDAYKRWIAEHPGTSPRMGIEENRKQFTLAELRKRAKQGDKQAAKLADELELGVAIHTALHRWPKDSPEYKELKTLYDENRNCVATKPTDELYQDLVAHIKNYGYYPMTIRGSLYTNLYNRLYYYRSTMVDGKYADPYLQKIYEIKQWSERVKRGEVDWQQFPGLFKKHRRTIGEMMREKGVLPQKEVTKELEQLPKEEQQAIEQMADNMLTLWEDFEDVWWQQNQKHIIATPQTQLAFNTVLNTVRNQVPGANNINISNVLEQVNSMQLGKDGPDYYRVIYRGDNPRIPRAEDFHNVEEITGLPQQYAQPAYKLNTPHISLDGDDEMVFNMFLTDGVTDREMSAVIDALTPAGWEVRIGAHEILSDIKNGQVHIHLEQIVPTTEEYAMDMSHVLNVNLRQLTRGKNPQQIAKTLRYLFSKYLKEDGRQALNNIQKAF